MAAGVMSEDAVATKSRVAFRVDASTRMGLGHLKRCASLSEALRAAGFTTQLVTRDLGSRLQADIGSKFDTICILPAPGAEFAPDPNIPHSQWAGLDQTTDAEQFLGALETAPDWIVLDHYAFDRQWLEVVRASTDARQLVIDDLGDRPLPTDILVDHNMAADYFEKHRLSQPRPRVLGGPRYALIAHAYAQAQRHLVSDTVRSIGIFMGGVDSPNATERALVACGEAGFEGAIEIVTTTANPNLRRLQEIASTDDRIDLSLDLADLTGFFASHDIQIGAGGGASWERCCIGAPSIVVQTADNQAIPLAGLREAGAALTSVSPDSTAIAQELRKLLADPRLRQTLSQHALALVDGRGSERVAVRLADAVELRPALAEDAEWVFAWRNHPDTRRYIFDPRELDLAEHIAWWRAAVTAPDRKLMIASVGTLPVGVLRLDRTGEEAEVSLYVDPALSGLGLGPKIIRAAAGVRFSGEVVHRLTARILDENQASRRSFEHADFVLKGDRWIRDLASPTDQRTHSA